jgi:hypothetical protein
LNGDYAKAARIEGQVEEKPEEELQDEGPRREGREAGEGRLFDRR